MTFSDRKRVLVVDDLVENIELLSSALLDDHEVQFATSGAQALALIKQSPPDLVLLDVMMPAMDGIETLQRIRSEFSPMQVPVILVTADIRQETQVAGLDSGADDFLTKPIELAVLRARVRNVLERRRLQAEQAALIVSLEAANREIARLLHFSEMMLSSAGDGIIAIDNQGDCTFVNPAALAVAGYERDDLLHHKLHPILHALIPGSATAHSDCPILATLHDGIRREGEDVFICRDGTPLPVFLVATALHRAGERLGVEVVFRDITNHQRLQQELVALANTDFLTGLANRRHFMTEATKELAAMHSGSPPAGLLMIDIDHFKQINDRHGHAAGDAVLRHFAGLIGNHLGRQGMAGRIGGEEFAILLPSATPEEILDFGNTLCRLTAASPVSLPEACIHLTVSIGITRLLATDGSIDAALARADRALYAAKTGGRNQTRQVLAA